MDDIRRQDAQRLAREVVAPPRLIASLLVGLVVWLIFAHQYAGLEKTVVAWLFLALTHYGLAAYAAEQKKWANPRMGALWAGCEDRMRRFEEVLKRMRKEQVADLSEMPKTIREVSQTIYAALRRADFIVSEVKATERNAGGPPVWDAAARDPQSAELYRLADRNIAEYRGHFAAVMAGVARTEAQSAVFMTTLDSLRMKLIGYRLVGRSPELATQEFLESIAEARTQLQAIDTALEELDLGHYPKTISVVAPTPPPVAPMPVVPGPIVPGPAVPTTPPPIPDDVQRRLNG